MRAPALALLQHPRAQSEIDLQLVAGRTFHAPERQLRPVRQLAHETFHRIIPAGERVPGDQILIKALGRKSRQQTLLNDFGQRGTLTGSARFGPGGHNGRF